MPATPTGDLENRLARLLDRRVELYLTQQRAAQESRFSVVRVLVDVVAQGFEGVVPDACLGEVDIAQQQNDPALEMMTLTSGACVDFTNCRFEQSLDRNLRAIELAGRAQRPGEESHAHYDLMHVYWAMGELEAASLHAEAMLEPAEQSGVRYWQSRAMDARENVSSAKGDWQVARAFSERGLALQPRDPVLLGCRALLEYQTGDFDAAEDYLQRLLSIFDNGLLRTTTYPNVFTMYYTVPSVVIAVAARITGVMERFDLVEAIARSLFTSPFAHPGPVNAARIGLALIAVQRGDVDAAGELYGELGIMGTMSPQCPILVDRFRHQPSPPPSA